MMSESEKTLATPAMSSPTEDLTLDYQSFNIFALVGFVFGLASAVSLFDEKLFWIIPAAGTLASLYALWTIARGDRAQVGRPLAIVGLCLSLFFLVAAPMAAVVERYYVGAESRAFADKWFEYLSHSDAVAAYDMTLNYSSRSYRNDLNDPQMHVNGVAMWAFYERSPWPQKLLDQRDVAVVEYVDTPVLKFHQGRYQGVLRYNIQMSKTDAVQPMLLRIERDKDHSTGTWHWRIVSLEPEIKKS